MMEVVMVKVFRYSKTGFKPRYQSHHLENILFTVTNDDLSAFNKLHNRKEAKSNYKKYQQFLNENFSDFRYGIWCFKDGSSIGPELNHLRESRPRWEAELPDDIEVYDTNLAKKYMLRDFPFGPMYVPRRSLENIQNVHRASQKPS